MKQVTLQHKNAAFGIASSSAQSIQSLAPTKMDLCVMSLYISSTTQTVSGISMSPAGNGTGTFERAHRQVGAVSAIEIWVGYAFTHEGVSTNFTIRLSGSGSQCVGWIGLFRNGAEQATAPTVSVAGASGTGGTVTAGPITPGEVDSSSLFFATYGVQAGTSLASPVMTPSPFQVHSGAASSRTSGWAHRPVLAVEPHEWSGTHTVDWVAARALITPVQPAVLVPNMYKGRKTSALDLGATV